MEEGNLLRVLGRCTMEMVPIAFLIPQIVLTQNQCSCHFLRREAGLVFLLHRRAVEMTRFLQWQLLQLRISRLNSNRKMMPLAMLHLQCHKLPLKKASRPVLIILIPSAPICFTWGEAVPTPTPPGSSTPARRRHAY